MDLRDSPGEAAFRDQARAWLADNAPKDWGGREDVAAWRAWSRKLYDAGYIGLTWPEEFGGRGAPYSHQAIFLEEAARVDAPPHIGVIGLGMAGPTIIAHGTDEQKQRCLKKILTAEEVWCQGFSEPDAGSDLSSVRTRAERRDGHYVVSGQKVWASGAGIADWCILVTRSDPESERHKGLTYLLVDMHAKGVEVRPLTQLTGTAEFSEIFFTDVEVPVENRLDEEGNGWAVAMTTLLHERGTLGFALAGALEATLRKLIELAKEQGVTDPGLRDRLAAEWIGLHGIKYSNYRSLTKLMQTGIPGPEGSGSKLWWSEANQRVTKLALEILGSNSQLTTEWQYAQLRSRGNTIEAGTSEILRGIIAERVLGLPRSR